MRINDFSVRIPEGTEDGSGYVTLNHGKQYTIQLRNSKDRPCDARILIDGQAVGTFRIKAHTSIRLERPNDDTGRFTFYEQDSAEYQKIQGPQVPREDRGLVQVVFIPALESFSFSIWADAGKKGSPFDQSVTRLDWTGNPTLTAGNEGNYQVYYTAMSSPPAGAKSGVTGLSGKSYQEFVQAVPLALDYSQETRITLRLISRPDEPRPLVNRGNPVPPPLG